MIQLMKLYTGFQFLKRNGVLRNTYETVLRLLQCKEYFYALKQTKLCLFRGNFFSERCHFE